MVIVNNRLKFQVTPDTGTLKSTVGNTPLLRLRRVTAGLSPQVQVFAKAEWLTRVGRLKTARH